LYQSDRNLMNGLASNTFEIQISEWVANNAKCTVRNTEFKNVLRGNWKS
jgi:hypothetical protein